MRPRAVPAASRVALTAAVVLGIVGSHAVAAAHDEVERGCTLVSRGEFAQALVALERAEASSTMERADVVRALECRALVRFASRDMEALAGDLRRIASLDPEHRLSEDFPPDVAATFAELARGRSALAVRVTIERADGRARVAAVTTGDDDDLVRRVRVRARVGRARWSEGTDVVELAASPEDAVAYEVTAIGPGGATLARSSDVSRGRIARLATSRRARPEASAVRRARADGPTAWPWVLAVAAGVVATGVVVGIVVATSEDGSQPSAPQIDWMPRSP
ncbi:MAG: hypothetical protein IT379_14140 [Deltaproteobacteria bacterium]|nr:hypothetical protein [Deltaproteobacteria bacterium]